MKPIIKICGITRVEDAQYAVALGARYIGCVIAPDSPRAASVEQIAAVRAALPSADRLVLALRGLPSDEILALCHALRASRVQVHDADHIMLDTLRGAGLLVHRVHAMDRAADALPTVDSSPRPDCPDLLDVGRGGSGRHFNWQLLAAGSPPQTLIAGGIGPGNVQRLLQYAPFGIDVSSGVERSPGIKDHKRMKSLFDRIYGVPA